MQSKFCKCGNIRASNHRYCLKCKSEYMKIWRLVNPLFGEQRKKMLARSKLHLYVKRGKIKKLPCEVCGRKEVEAHHDDYDKALDVRWLCKFHHLRHHGKFA